MIWLWSLPIGLLVTIAVLSERWKLVGKGLGGLGFVLLTLAYPMAGLLIWVTLGPGISSYVKLDLPPGVPDLSMERVTVASLLIALGIQVIVRTRRLTHPEGIEKTMLLFWILVAGDIWFRGGSFGSDMLVFLDEFGVPFLLFYIAKNLVSTPREACKLPYAFMLLGLYLGIWGLVQYVLYGATGGPSTGAVDTKVVEGVLQYEAVEGHLQRGRAVGPFYNAAEYGGIVVYGFLWTLFIVLHLTRGATRFFLLVPLALSSLGVVLSLTRSVWLSFLVATVLIAAFDRRWRRSILAGLATAVAGGVLVAGVMLANPQRLEERTFELVPIYQRLIMYEAATLMILESPVIGYGKGKSAFVSQRQKYVSNIGSISADYGLQAGPPHNVYLYTLLQWGLVGFIPYMALFVFLVRSAMMLRRLPAGDHRIERRFADFFLASTCVYLILGVFLDVATLNVFTSLYFVLGGAVEGMRYRVYQPSRQLARRGARMSDGAGAPG